MEFCFFGIPRPSIYPLLLDPKDPLLGAIYPYLRAQGGSWLGVFVSVLGVQVISLM